MPSIDATLPSAADQQPIVVEVDPSDGAEVSTDAGVSLNFSVPIDPVSVGAKSIAIISKPESSDEAAIAEDVVDKKVEAWAGEYVVSEDGCDVSFLPDPSYAADAEYTVVVTSVLRSRKLVPFNQTPGSSPTPFISAFKTAGAGGGGGGSGDGSDSGDGGNGGDGGDSGDGGGGDGDDDDPVEPPKVRPSWLVITELLYDIPGSDTDGDLFIELAGEASTEISGYEIAFVNGSDGKIYDTISISDDSFIPEDGVFVIADAITGSPGTSRVESADLIVNFDPQNGPDGVQLLDDAGILIDAVGYGEPMVELAENDLVAYEGTPAVDVGSGMSIARVDTFDTDDNSLDFIQLEVPSPGVVEVAAE
jgi:hypothetical protein